MRDNYITLQKVEFSPAEIFEIKSMASCCGCKTLLFNTFINEALAEQFVVETNCGLYSPTKHYFDLDTKGQVLAVKSLVAVTDNSFSIPASELDIKAFQKLDSIYNNWSSVNKRNIVFAEIKGFKEGENTHSPFGVKIRKNR